MANRRKYSEHPSLTDATMEGRADVLTKTKLLSPFRYPGGKTWLVPTVFRWLASLKATPSHFVEPFAGGGIVGLNVAAYGLAQRVTFVEIDNVVSSVWKTMISGDYQRLVDRIGRYKLTRQSAVQILGKTAENTEDQAFAAILRNRISRGGILAAGAGILRRGENGNGIGSRWYPNTLKDRLTAVASMRERLSFIQGDGLSVIKRLAHVPDAVFFIDPPYTYGHRKAGRRLYQHHELDHAELFRLVSKLKGDFLITYSSGDRVRELAKRHGFDVAKILMRTCNHKPRLELLIGRDLTWFKGNSGT